jgi:hypothetical protein
MLGHKRPVVTLEKDHRFVPNLARDDGLALLVLRPRYTLQIYSRLSGRFS